MKNQELKRIKKLAVANRGEVAVRIIRACQDLGIQTVLLHSEADIQTRAYRMADERVCIGPAATRESYLNVERNVEAAKASGADAVHPGFGFLSENADFAQSVVDAGIIFIGPSARAIRAMGDKVEARRIMQKAGVPVVPGYEGESIELSVLQSEALKIGFPLMIKASGGGGGRGLRVVNDMSQFATMLESAQREATSSFGNSHVFLERYLKGAKHIEFQVFGDLFGNVIHFMERECSVQRRHQKVIEEALSPALSTDLREKMGQAAVAAAKAVNYAGAGTVEFLLSGNEFFFMEMNTRLQVEHPVTELVQGIDLVKMQIKTAEGQPLSIEQRDVVPRGHAIECRLYAEDAYQNGMPSTGPIFEQIFPEGPGCRFDYGFEKGDTITPYYDPMIAKIIVWDETRSRCIDKTLRVLSDTIIFGVKTNIPFLKALLNHPEFRNGKMTTQFIENYFSNGLTTPDKPEWLDLVIHEAKKLTAPQTSSMRDSHTPVTPWTQSWRIP